MCLLVGLTDELTLTFHTRNDFLQQKPKALCTVFVTFLSLKFLPPLKKYNFAVSLRKKLPKKK